jgi:hypothetical protein
VAVALSAARADVAGIDIAGTVSPILDFPPATIDDLQRTGELVKAQGGRWMQRVADRRHIDQIRAAAEAITLGVGQRPSHRMTGARR